MSAVPADSNPIADLPRIRAGTECLNHSRDLMTWRAWINDSREGAVLGQRIAVTDAAGLNLHPDTTSAGFGDWLLLQFESSARAAHISLLHDRSFVFR